jgi:hypothetical protein
MLNKIPFADNLRYIGKGAINDELTEKMAELVKSVRETGKPGEITLKIKVAMMASSNEDMVKLTPFVVAKIPETDSPVTIMYSTADGDLLREDPDKVQNTLRQVDDAVQPLRKAE